MCYLTLMKRYDQEEFFAQLATVQPCDLRSEKTLHSDAVEFCKKIFTVFETAKDFVPNHDRLALNLYRKGACEYNKAAEKFVEMKGARVEDLLKIQGNIQFPLSAFTQILNTSDQAYQFAWMKMQSGLLTEWLNAQKTVEMGLTH